MSPTVEPNWLLGAVLTVVVLPWAWATADAFRRLWRWRNRT